MFNLTPARYAPFMLNNIKFFGHRTLPKADLSISRSSKRWMSRQDEAALDAAAERIVSRYITFVQICTGVGAVSGSIAGTLSMMHDECPLFIPLGWAGGGIIGAIGGCAWGVTAPLSVPILLIALMRKNK